MKLEVNLDSDEAAKIVVASMREMIEIMSKEPTIPFVSADPKEDKKYRKKMIKAAKRVLKWHTVPSEWEEGWDD
jgi:hypothetical protein